MSGGFVEHFSYRGDDAQPESSGHVSPTCFGQPEDELGVCVPQAREVFVYVEWQARGIALEGTELDAAPILQAAGESLRLWT